ncbi:MAG: acetyl-CoA carboxylase biotin carboxylase subunit family protein [Muribaculaceae bacterium]
MNVIFISPHFPLHFWNFCDRLKRLGVNVLGIGDAPYDGLLQEVKSSLSEYFYVTSLEDYEQVYRAVGYYINHYGRIDHVESQNEYWLQLEARVRTDFNIPSGWHTSDMEAVKLKSQMKQGYKRAGVKTARFHLIDGLDGAMAFAHEVGYPVIVKPDNGVGASNTWKLLGDEQLAEKYREVISHHPANYFVMEEFVPGHVETFDGIVNAEGEVIFFTGQVMKATPLAQLQGTGENVSYTQPVERLDDLRTAGLRTVAAFGVRNRFFHFEFFRLDEDKPGLGSKGDIIGLEVNMRAPGGYIPDKMNYAYNVDVYQIWAEMLVFGENRSFPHWEFQRYVTHFGRSERVEYRYDADDVRRQLGDRLLIERVPPKSIAGGMGAQVFIAWSNTTDELEQQARYVLERNDGTNWM